MLMSPFETTVYPRKGVPVQLNESNENYLERMLMIQQERGQVRSVDVATAMGVSRASVAAHSSGGSAASSANPPAPTPKGLRSPASRAWVRFLHGAG